MPLLPLALVVLSGCAFDPREFEDTAMSLQSDDCRSRAMTQVSQRSPGNDKTGGKDALFRSAYRACMMDKGFSSDTFADRD